MRELNQMEVQAVNGAGMLREFVDDLIYTLRQLPTVYDTAIGSTADMMCRATDKC